MEHNLDLNAVYMFIELEMAVLTATLQTYLALFFLFFFSALLTKGTTSDSFIQVH